MDEDLQNFNQEALIEEVKKLRNAIREDRDAAGHDLCWYRPELWGMLPEGFNPKPNVPPTEEFLACCKKYRKSLDNV